MSRKDDQNRMYRFVLLVSLGGALLAHVALFLWNPTFEVTVPERDTPRIRLEMRFGEPEVQEVSVLGLSPDSLVEVELARVPRLFDLMKHWPAPYRAYSVGGSASLRLQVDSLGTVVGTYIVESSGDTLKDEAFTRLASSLRYRLSTPGLALEGVEVVQGMTVVQLPYAVEVRSPSR